MSELLFSLQLQYANALYQAEKFTHEAELVKSRLTALAHEAAVADTTPKAVTEDSAEGMGDAADKPSTKPRKELQISNYGVCAAVAKSLGLSHQHVRQVSLGRRVSTRVSEALDVELRSREGKSADGRVR